LKTEHIKWLISACLAWFFYYIMTPLSKTFLESVIVSFGIIFVFLFPVIIPDAWLEVDE